MVCEYFSEVSSNEMWCFDIETGESWTLEIDQDLTLYSVTSDGEYVYSCAPWGGTDSMETGV